MKGYNLWHGSKVWFFQIADSRQSHLSWKMENFDIYKSLCHTVQLSQVHPEVRNAGSHASLVFFSLGNIEEIKLE